MKITIKMNQDHLGSIQDSINYGKFSQELSDWLKSHTRKSTHVTSAGTSPDSNWIGFEIEV